MRNNYASIPMTAEKIYKNLRENSTAAMLLAIAWLLTIHTHKL